jgi:tetratricopeptide (TPR) repeat protein
MGAHCPAAFRAGRLEEAFDLYSQVIHAEPLHLTSLCNRSLAALRMGKAFLALQDAQDALAIIEAGDGPQVTQAQLSKIYHRKAAALLALNRTIEAIKTYKAALAAGCKEPALVAALQLACERLPPVWLARYWASRIENAQFRNQLSSRDGVLLKPVPSGHRLTPDRLQHHLETALEAQQLQAEARALMCAAWVQGWWRCPAPYRVVLTSDPTQKHLGSMGDSAVQLSACMACV